MHRATGSKGFQAIAKKVGIFQAATAKKYHDMSGIYDVRNTTAPTTFGGIRYRGTRRRVSLTSTKSYPNQAEVLKS